MWKAIVSKINLDVVIKQLSYTFHFCFCSMILAACYSSRNCPLLYLMLSIEHNLVVPN